MAEIINLNKFRKKKTLADEVQKAEENRAKHGRTKAEKNKSKSEASREKLELDGKKLDDA